MLKKYTNEQKKRRNLYAKERYRIAARNGLDNLFTAAIMGGRHTWMPISVRPDIDCGIKNANQFVYDVKLSNGKTAPGCYNVGKWTYTQGDEYSSSYRGPRWTVEYWSMLHSHLRPFR